MRVLHIRSSRGFYGAEALIEVLSLGQARAGDEVFVACLVDAREPHTELLHRFRPSDGVETLEIYSEGRFSPRVVQRIVRFCTQKRIDLLHVHDYKTILLGLPASWALSVPIVATFHGEVADNPLVSAYEFAARQALRCFHAVAVVSRAQEKLLQSPWRISQPVFVPNAVRTSWIEKPVRSPEAPLTIGTVGRLCADKGQADVMPTMARLLKENPTMRWLIAGDGPDQNALKALAASHGLRDEIHFAGFVEDRASLYAEIDVLLHPSRREGLPMTILEAMSAKIPVLATGVGEIPSVLSSGGGHIVRDFSRDIPAHLCRYLHNPEDLQAEGLAAAQTVENRFSEARLARDYDTLIYQPAMEGGRDEEVS